MEIEIKRKKIISNEEVVEKIKLPKLPYYYYNNSTRQFIRVLSRYYKKDNEVSEENGFSGLDITIVPEQNYGWDLKIQRFKISMENFNYVLNKGIGLAYDILKDIISPSNCFEKSAKEFDREMEIAVFKITREDYSNSPEKHSGHP